MDFQDLVFLYPSLTLLNSYNSFVYPDVSVPFMINKKVFFFPLYGGLSYCSENIKLLISEFSFLLFSMFHCDVNLRLGRTINSPTKDNTALIEIFHGDVALLVVWVL